MKKSGSLFKNMILLTAVFMIFTCSIPSVIETDSNKEQRSCIYADMTGASTDYIEWTFTMTQPVGNKGGNKPPFIYFKWALLPNEWVEFWLNLNLTY